MRSLYRHLLYLYPAPYRSEYGEEMLIVFSEVRADAAQRGQIAHSVFLVREARGLLLSALRERIRSVIGPQFAAPLLPPSFSSRRFAMTDSFRFSKATAVLMALILGGVLLAIQKAEAIHASLPQDDPPVGPIHPVHSMFVPGIMLLFLYFYAAGLMGWAVLFALRRAGVHRLSQMPSTESK
jgi:hypothetical protein